MAAASRAAASRGGVGPSWSGGELEEEGVNDAIETSPVLDVKKDSAGAGEDAHRAVRLQSAVAGEHAHHALVLSVDVAMPECSGTSMVWVGLSRSDGEIDGKDVDGAVGMVPVPDAEDDAADAGEHAHHASVLSVDVAMPECSGTSLVWVELS